MHLFHLSFSPFSSFENEFLMSSTCMCAYLLYSIRKSSLFEIRFCTVSTSNSPLVRLNGNRLWLMNNNCTLSYCKVKRMQAPNQILESTNTLYKRCYAIAYSWPYTQRERDREKSSVCFGSLTKIMRMWLRGKRNYIIIKYSNAI